MVEGGGGTNSKKIKREPEPQIHGAFITSAWMGFCKAIMSKLPSGRKSFSLAWASPGKMRFIDPGDLLMFLANLLWPGKLGLGLVEFGEAPSQTS